MGNLMKGTHLDTLALWICPVLDDDFDAVALVLLLDLWCVGRDCDEASVGQSVFQGGHQMG